MDSLKERVSFKRMICSQMIQTSFVNIFTNILWTEWTDSLKRSTSKEWLVYRSLRCELNQLIYCKDLIHSYFSHEWISIGFSQKVSIWLGIYLMGHMDHVHDHFYGPFWSVKHQSLFIVHCSVRNCLLCSTKYKSSRTGLECHESEYISIFIFG